VTKEYDRKFQAITKSITMVAMFFVTSFISIPPSVQDMAVSGYTALLHIRLYHIYPVLVVIPTLFLAVIVHFLVQSNQSQRRLEFAKLFKSPLDPPDVPDPLPTTAGEYDVESHTPLAASSKSRVLPIQEALQPRVIKHMDRRQSLVKGLLVAAKAEQIVRNSEEELIIQANVRTTQNDSDNGSDSEETISSKNRKKSGCENDLDNHSTDSDKFHPQCQLSANDQHQDLPVSKEELKSNTNTSDNDNELLSSYGGSSIRDLTADALPSNPTTAALDIVVSTHSSSSKVQSQNCSSESSFESFSLSSDSDKQNDIFVM
jgi:hypothetical protein